MVDVRTPPRLAPTVPPCPPYEYGPSKREDRVTTVIFWLMVAISMSPYIFIIVMRFSQW